MCLRLTVLSMWGLGGLEVFGICSRRLVYHEVTEARSNNIRNLICEDLKIPLLVIRLEVTGLKKTRLVYVLDLFKGSGEERWCDLVCEKSL